jgi:Na+/H+ antiporter NhaD/arsenite permease-like protein
VLAYITLSIDETGLIEAMACKVAQKSRNTHMTYAALYILFIFMSCLVGNDPVIMSGTPFLVYLTSFQQIDPHAWIFSQFVAANIGSMILVIGNPTNVLVSQAFALDYLSYSLTMIFPAITSIAVAYVYLHWFFRASLPIEMNNQLSETRSIKDWTGALVGVCIFAALLLALVVTSFYGVDVWITSVPCGLLMLGFDCCRDWFQQSQGFANQKQKDSEIELVDIDVIRTSAAPELQTSHSSDKLRSRIPQLDAMQNSFKQKFPKVSHVFCHLPWALLPFCVSQFILVEMLVHDGWIATFASFFDPMCTWDMFPRTVVFGFISILCCNICGTNIGSTLLLVKILQAMPCGSDCVYSLAFGSNVGAFSLVFSASLAGLLWKDTLNKRGINVTLQEFIRTSLPLCMCVSICGLSVIGLEQLILG